MRALVVDDERLARVELKRLLKNVSAAGGGEVEVVGEAANITEARAALSKLEVDVLFLDIQMPGGTGFELLESLEGDAPAVIFTTAYDEHAVKAFEFNALDYLVKPIEPRRLEQALAKVPLEDRTAERTEPALERVFVRDGERCWFVQLAEVPYFESEGNYVRLPLGGHEPLLPRSLNYLEQKLDPKRFFRASRQHIVNLAFIASMETGPEGRLVVQLKDGKEIEMSRRQSQKFKETMSA